LLAQRTHDVLTAVHFLRTAKVGDHPNPSSIAIVGLAGVGPIAAAARAVAGTAIDKAAIDTNGFRFGNLLDYRDVNFLPGGSKYLDIPGMLAVAPPSPLWLAGEGSEPAMVKEVYKKADKGSLELYAGDKSASELAAVEWLLK
jgi:hypothetical protein